MSETLITGYYNTKINNHDWVIYMGGEKYFPAYPAKYIEPEPEKKIVKRYLLKDSSKHYSYDNYKINIYPLTTLDAYINENDETMEFEGNTYYVWRGWNQYHEDVIPDTIKDYGINEQLCLLTTTLEPQLPFKYGNPDFVYMLSIDSHFDKTEYFDGNYTFVAQVNVNEDGVRKVKMSNIGVRMYSYESEQYYLGNNNGDYFQYDGEIVEYEGQKCFVWNRYAFGGLCDEEGNFGAQKILTNTLWIKTLPFTMDSPEFVTWFDYDEHYGKPDKIPFDRIEYIPDVVFEPNPIVDVGKKTNINVKTYLVDNYDEPLSNPINIHYVYNGETMQWNGKTCYVWKKEDLYRKGYDRYGYWPYIVLTNTLDITLPLNHNEYYFETAFDYEDNVGNYKGMGDGTIGHASKKAKYIIRDYGIQYNPPIYKNT